MGGEARFEFELQGSLGKRPRSVEKEEFKPRFRGLGYERGRGREEDRVGGDGGGEEGEEEEEEVGRGSESLAIPTPFLLLK